MGDKTDARDSLAMRYESRAQFARRVLRPPIPVYHNRREPMLPPIEGLGLWIGGAGAPSHAGFVNIDIVHFPGVDIVADLHTLPFADNSVQNIECDAVLEHVRDPRLAVTEIFRVLRPGGFLHVVVPFCHPVHLYPADYSRWTIDGLRELLGAFEVIDTGVRTGPTATLLTFFLEYLKVLSPAALRKPVYAAAGWLLWPMRYLDRWLLRRSNAHVLANSIYALVKKPNVATRS